MRPVPKEDDLRRLGRFGKATVARIVTVCFAPVAFRYLHEPALLPASVLALM